MSAANDVEVVGALARVTARVQAVYGSWRRSTTVETMRQDWDALFRAETGVPALRPFMANGVEVAWVESARAEPGRILVYFHGGGFKVGSIRSHHALMHALAERARCRVLGVNYRLSPEHGYPAPVEDALAVCAWLREQGFDHRTLAFAGDSAGGNLALCTLLRLRDAGFGLPCAAVLMSAWTDLSASGASYATRADQDPIHQRWMIQGMAEAYLAGNADPTDPRVSPLRADLKGLPPLLLQVGDHETVLDDSRDFAYLAEAAGVDARLEVYERMIHVFQQFLDELPEAAAALGSAADFLDECWRGGAGMRSPSGQSTT